MGDENAVRDEDFNVEAEHPDAVSPPIETMGARYGIGVMSVHGGARGAHQPQQSPYLMPSVKMRNGGTERVADSIGLTPLGGLMPGPNAIAPAVRVGGVGITFPMATGEPVDFHQGVSDSWPEGSPVPVK